MTFVARTGATLVLIHMIFVHIGVVVGIPRIDPGEEYIGESVTRLRRCQREDRDETEVSPRGKALILTHPIVCD